MPAEPMILANLLHLSYNMWGDWDRPGAGKYWAAKPYLRFEPVHLRLFAQLVRLRNEYLPRSQSQFFLSSAHVPSHRRLRYFGAAQLRFYPFVDPVCGVPLLSWPFPVLLEDSINECFDWPKLWFLSLGALSFSRHRVLQRCPHEPPVHSEFLCYPSDRPNSVLVFPSDLFVHFHLLSPFQPSLRTGCLPCSE